VPKQLLRWVSIAAVAAGMFSLIYSGAGGTAFAVVGGLILVAGIVGVWITRKRYP